MNRKLKLSGLAVCVAAGVSLTSCGGMWLDSGSVGVYDDYGPYWQPGPPPPPSYGSMFGHAWGWDGPVYYPGAPGVIPPAVNRPLPSGSGGNPGATNPGNPGVGRPSQKPGPGNTRPGSGLPSNPNLSRPGQSDRPSSGKPSGSVPSTRPESGAAGRR